MPQRNEMPLQLHALLHGQALLACGPGLNEGAVASQPVRQMADGERVRIGVVVAQKRTEIVQDQKGRSIAPVGRQKLCLIAGAREGLAVDARDTRLLPARKCPKRPALVARGGVALGQLDFVAPGLARDPVRLPQISGGRTERIGDRVPDIAAPIAIEIDRVGGIGRRNELGVPHGAGPRPVEMSRVRIALLQDLQGRDDLSTGEFRLHPRTGQGHERLDHLLVALVGAVVGFHAPDGQNDVLVDTVLGLDLIEQLAILNELLLAHGEALGRNGTVHILAHRLLVFRLVARGLDDFLVVRDPGGRLLERIPTDAGTFGGGPEALHAGLKLVRIRKARHSRDGDAGQASR